MELVVCARMPDGAVRTSWAGLPVIGAVTPGPGRPTWELGRYRGRCGRGSQAREDDLKTATT